MVRTLTLRIENRTTVVWYRAFHNAFSYQWSLAPPEVLAPGHTQECEITRKTANELELNVQYAFVCRSVLYVLFTNCSSSASGALNCKCGYRELTAPKQDLDGDSVPLDGVRAHDILLIHKTIVDAERVCVITLMETAKGKEYLESSREEVFSKFERMKASWVARLNLPPTLTASRKDSVMREVSGDLLDDTLSDLDGSVVGEDDDDEWDLEWFETDLAARPETKKDWSEIYNQLAVCLKTVPMATTRRFLVESARRNLPESFLWRVCNKQWEMRLTAKKYSTYIRIVNHTRHTLVCDIAGALKSLDDCQFQEFPNELIGPAGFTDFGIATEKFPAFKFTFGVTVAFKVVANDSHDVDWHDARSKGSLVVQIETSTTPATKIRFNGTFLPDADLLEKPDICIVGHTESLNEGIVQIYVLDQQQPPVIQILTARALPRKPKLSTPFLGSDDYLNKRNQWLNEGARSGVDLTQLLQTKMYNHYVANESSDCIFIPRRLFWWADLFKARENRSPAVPLISNYNLGSIRNLLSELGDRSVRHTCLFLQWKIDSVIYSGYFDQSDSIHLNSSLVHGMSNSHDNFITIVNDERSLIAPMVLDAINTLAYELTAGTLEDCPLLQKAIQRWEATNANETLMSAVHQTLFLFAEGAGPYVNKAIAGGWNRNLVPHGHLWDFQDRSTVDAEGLLYVINTQWESGVASAFPSDGIQKFKSIQTLNSFWASQNIDHITLDLVLSAMRDTIYVLHCVEQISMMSELYKTYNALNKKWSGKSPSFSSQSAASPSTPPDSHQLPSPCVLVATTTGETSSIPLTEASPEWSRGIGWSLGPVNK